MKTVAIVIFGTALCIGTIFYFINGLFSNKHINNRPCTEIAFDSRLWKDSFLIRGRMVNNLITSKRLISLSKDSVEKLMGKPTASNSEMMDYMFDPNCGNKEFAEIMILYIKIDSAKKVVTDYWTTD